MKTKDTWGSTIYPVNRLMKVWREHKDLIIATDFDDTVYPYTHEESRHDDAIRLLKECSDLGFTITVQTCSHVERYPMIREFFLKHNIKIAGINTTPEHIEYGHEGKAYYNLILDDRAGLGQAIEILEWTLKLIKQETDETDGSV